MDKILLRYGQAIYQKYESIIDSYIESGQSAELGRFPFIGKYCTFDKRKTIETIYNTLRTGGSEKNFRPTQKMLWEQNPEIKEVIDKFGIEKLKAVSFKLEKIKELYREETPEVNTKIATKLKQKIKVGSVYTRKEISDILTIIYNDIGVEKESVKATVIKKYYEVQPYTRSGKPNVSCFRINSVKSKKG
jgi:hypothetical protein